ncbi:hypothetical protein QOT17_014190 [Balamuthia mandrillaris]
MWGIVQLLLLFSLLLCGCDGGVHVGRFRSPVDYYYDGWGCAFRGLQSSSSSHEDEETTRKIVEESNVPLPLLGENAPMRTGVEPDCEVFFFTRDGEGEQTLTERDGTEEEEGESMEESFNSSSYGLTNNTSSRLAQRFLITYSEVVEVRVDTRTGERKESWGPYPFSGRDILTRGPVDVNDTFMQDGELQVITKEVIQFDIPFEKGTIHVVYTIFQEGKAEEKIGARTNQTISIPARTVKVTLVIPKWRFEEEQLEKNEERYERFLEVSMKLFLIDEDGRAKRFNDTERYSFESDDDGNGTEAYSLPFFFGETSAFALTTRFLTVAEVDGALRRISVKGHVTNSSQPVSGLPREGLEVRLAFPRFNSSLLYDPDFSVLTLDKAEEDEPDGGEEEEGFCCQSAGFYAVVSVVVLLAALAVLSGLAAGFWRRKLTNRRFTHRNPVRTSGMIQADILSLNKAVGLMDCDRANDAASSPKSESNTEEEATGKCIL